MLYWLTFRISYVARKIDPAREERVSTIAARLNTTLLLAIMEFQSTHPELAFYALLVLGSLEFIFGQLPVTRRRRPAFIVLTIVGCLLMLGSVPFKFSGNNIALLWMIAAEALLAAGIAQAEVVFRRIALMTGMATGGLVIWKASFILDLRQQSEGRLLHDGVLLLACSLLFYVNAHWLARRWKEVFSGDRSDLCHPAQLHRSRHHLSWHVGYLYRAVDRRCLGRADAGLRLDRAQAGDAASARPKLALRCRGPAARGHHQRRVLGSVAAPPHCAADHLSHSCGAVLHHGRSRRLRPITLTAKDPTGKTVQSITFNVIVTSIPANAGLSLTNAGPVTIAAGAATNNAATLTLSPVNGFIGEVNFTCVVTTSMMNVVNPPTCQNSFAWITTAASQTITLPFTTQKSTPPGTYGVAVTATDGINASITATTIVALTITPWHGVWISIDPYVLTIGAGATTGNILAMTLTPSGGFTGTVNLSCLGPLSDPPGAVSPVVCTVPGSINIPGPAPVTATVTANTTASTTIGTYNFGVNVYDAVTSAWYSGTDISVNVQPGPGLSITKSGDITVAPGATTGNTSALTVMPSGGFTGQVNLACALTSKPAGAANLPTCSVPSSVTITGTTAATATLTINTTAASSSGLDLPLRRFFLAGGGATLAMVVFFGIPSRRRAWRALFSFLAIAFALSTLGCGGGGGTGGSGSIGGGGGGGTGGTGGGSGDGTGGGTPGTTAGTYTFTVTGTDAASGKITATTIVTLTVT